MRLNTTLAVMLLALCVSGGEAAEPTSSSASFPARNAAAFRPRANVARLILHKRSQDEDKLRVALLACAQSDDELQVLTAMINGRWDRKNIQILAGWLLEDWDKQYGPSLRRPKSIFPLLIYIRNHEKPYAFKDGQEIE